ncbi:MAG TPA: hypothetical protein VGM06_21545 [Polyangiaceae bacterium]|jgi:hypothetical protein
MFVVAIAELVSPTEDDMTAIAAAIGASTYDVRMRLAAGVPAVLMTTSDEAAARATAQAIGARGHGAIVCDSRDVVPGPAMVPVRHFVLGEDALRADRAQPDELPYRQMRVLVHVAHRELRHVIGHEMVYVGPREGMARREVITDEHDSPHSLYIFPSDGTTPWILREREAHYTALGAAAGPARHMNFLATIAALRARAPIAHFDDRFATHPRSPSHYTRSYGHPEGESSPWADHDADLAAHLLARWLSRTSSDPYRSTAG